MNAINMLKDLLSITEAELSERTGIPVSRLASISASETEPTTADLRDLATVASISVTDLLGLEHDTTGLCETIREDRLRLGGYLALSFEIGPDFKYHWPISIREAERIKPLLATAEEGDFVRVDTLNNCTLRVCPSNLAMAEVEDPIVALDWVQDSGQAPPEVYRALNEWRQNSKAFAANNSDALKRLALDLAERKGWRRRSHALLDAVRSRVIYQRDSTTITGKDSELMIHHVQAMLSFEGLAPGKDGSEKRWEWNLPMDDVAIISLPLNEVSDGHASIVAGVPAHWGSDPSLQVPAWVTDVKARQAVISNDNETDRVAALLEILKSAIAGCEHHHFDLAATYVQQAVGEILGK